MTWLRAAAAAGHPSAAGQAAAWMWEVRRDVTLEPQLRRGAEESPDARKALAQLLESTGRAQEAIRVLEEDVARGGVQHLLHLGNLYLDAGDYSRAAEMYERDIQTGDPLGYHNLGALLEERGDISGAMEQYRIGASSGDSLALQAYERLRTDR